MILIIPIAVVLLILAYIIFVTIMRMIVKEVTHTTDRPWYMKVYMRFSHGVATTTPWRTIYYKYERDLTNERLRKHELCHIDQIEREGWIVQGFKYTYYQITVGYEKNPYELEARKAELL